MALIDKLRAPLADLVDERRDPGPGACLDGDTEAIRARRCLDGLWLVLLERNGTDALEEMLLDAKRYSESDAWKADYFAEEALVGQRHALAREFAERLFRGRP